MAGPWEKFTVNPETPKGPAGPWEKFNPTASDEQEFEQKHGFTPSPVQDFGATLLDDLGGLVPNVAHTAASMVRHPIDTTMQIGRNMINLPDTLGDEFKSRPGKAVAHMMELGAPAALEGIGSASRAMAPKLAETAMRVGKGERLTGANPGRALIEETSKVRPASIARDLSAKGAQLANEESRMAAASPNSGNLAPAISPIAARQSRAIGAGATSTAEQLQPMRDFFEGEAPPGFAGTTVPGPGGNPRISPTQPASQLLSMRREFTPNFRIRYGPAADSTIQKVGRQAYQGLTGEVKNAIPGISEIDDRLHDIIPASKAAESTSRNAGLFQRTAGRLAAHTGALAGGLYGYHAGGIPGALLGIAGPEMAASPTVQMGLARALQFGGKSLPAIGAAAKPLTLMPRQKEAK